MFLLYRHELISIGSWGRGNLGRSRIFRESVSRRAKHDASFACIWFSEQTAQYVLGFSSNHYFNNKSLYSLSRLPSILDNVSSLVGYWSLGKKRGRNKGHALFKDSRSFKCTAKPTFTVWFNCNWIRLVCGFCIVVGRNGTAAAKCSGLTQLEVP